METDATSILVIDDDLVSRELLQLLLRRQGYPVKTVDSGHQALQQLKDHNSVPRVVLVDLQMPGISGARLAGALREVCGESSILIAMSGSSPDETAAQDYDAFLLKPFTMDQFAAALTTHSQAAPANATAVPPAHRLLPALDQAVYDKLSSAMHPEKLEQLYRLCLEDVKKRIAAMRQSVSQDDDESYRRQAHAIKGGCGMIGAAELQTLATTMENNGLAANHVATLDEFLLACDRLERMLNAREIATM